MKEVLKSIFFAVSVVAVAIVWYSFSNNFTGVISQKEEFIPSAETVMAQGQAGVETPVVDTDQVVKPPSQNASATTTVIKAVFEKDIFLRSPYCRTQHDDFLKRKGHTEIAVARKNDPQLYDVKCFMVNESVDPNTLEKCLTGKNKSVVVNEAMEAVMCQAFLKVYQTYVTDFLYPDDVDVKSLSQNVLQKKIQAQLLKHNKNPQLMSAMTQTLIESYPNDFEALKIYIKSLGFGQRPAVYAEGGPLYSYLVKAYGLNPRDLEIREIYMYALIHSPDGEVKLLKTFPNVKEDGKLQALRYYYLAWAGWNKGDRTQALNNLEFAKSLSNNDPRFTEAYDKVKDQVNVLKSEGIFYLSFSLI